MLHYVTIIIARAQAENVANIFFRGVACLRGIPGSTVLPDHDRN